ncbi:hypothetical protein QFC20_005817 [Naganishia adeliensis]|uniref:Uncharacterized protein n=1 Tax=Naganishia adeliensis TaxID=92952 RepID=A0ACC2VJ30_9TREE|nr:hypothetical protein QFC20_005817 [Naganishia adeliensis]
MYFNTVFKILAFAWLGSLSALAFPLENRAEPPPASTVPTGPTPSGVPNNGVCCGYELVNRGGAYFRYKHEIEFNKRIRGRWEISHGWQVGRSNPSTGQEPIANENNIVLVPDYGLRLMVPIQHRNASAFSAAEVIFPDIILGGVIEAEIKMTGVKGTVMDFMTTHADNKLNWGNLGWKDAQVMELVGNSLLESDTGPSPVGINMVNFDAETGAQSATSQKFPSGVNPSVGFSKYSIAWYPPASINNPGIDKNTYMAFNDQPLNAPPKYSAVNPQVVSFSHWCNADTKWAGLPPNEDSSVIIKRVVAYYDRPIKMATGIGISRDTCKRENACKVYM